MRFVLPDSAGRPIINRLEDKSEDRPILETDAIGLLIRDASVKVEDSNFRSYRDILPELDFYPRSGSECLEMIGARASIGGRNLGINIPKIRKCGITRCHLVTDNHIDARTPGIPRLPLDIEIGITHTRQNCDLPRIPFICQSMFYVYLRTKRWPYTGIRQRHRCKPITNIPTVGKPCADSGVRQERCEAIVTRFANR